MLPPLTPFRWLEPLLNREQAGLSYARRPFGLERITLLLRQLENPQGALSCYHVAGTKGKGSVSQLLALLLQQGGYRTGLYLSPHLCHPYERIQLGGRPLPARWDRRLETKFSPVFADLARQHLSPSYFEAMTAAAFVCFADSRADRVVLETGLGGRLDATNVIPRPRAAILTSIDLEHQEILGRTLGRLAREKFGILKTGHPVISGIVQPDLRRQLERFCRPRGCSLRQEGKDFSCQVLSVDNFSQTLEYRSRGRRYGPLTLPVLGRHQARNLSLALAAWEAAEGALPSLSQLNHWLSTASLPARIQWVQRSPAVLLDTAHTPGSFRALRETLRCHLPKHHPLFIAGLARDKNPGALLRHLSGPGSRLFLVPYPSTRATTAAEWRRLVRTCWSQTSGSPRPRVFPSWQQAYQTAWTTISGSSPPTVICFTGSFYLAGEVLAHNPRWADRAFSRRSW